MTERPDVRCARGQSLVEFLVVAIFFLVPLMMIIPVLAQMISLRQETEEAARYAVWERTVWYRSEPDHPEAGLGPTLVKGDAAIGAEIDARIFREPRAQILSSGGPETDFDPFYKVMNPGTADLQPMIVNLGDATNPQYNLFVEAESAPTGLAGALSSVVSALGGLTTLDFNFQGLFTSDVSINLIEFPWLGASFTFAAPDTLVYSRRNTLLTDTWSAGGTEHGELIVSGLTPQGLLLDNSTVESIQDTIALLPFANELDSDWLDFGYMTISPVPAHRLSDYN